MTRFKWNKPDELFNEISLDRSLGSRELAAVLLEELLIWTLETPPLPEEKIEQICCKIINLRKEMAVITNVGYLLLRKFKQNSSQSSDRFATALRSLRAELERTETELIKQMKGANLPDRDVLCFSRSSTILNLLEKAPQLESVVVLHSYPGEEGIDLAEELVGDIDVTFAYDVEAGYFLPEVDALYLGVDTLFANGAIVNKTGSRLLASAAGDTPVRAVTSLWKLAVNELIPEVPRFPSPGSLPEKIQRNHPLFEVVPENLIDSYITDRGVFKSIEKLLQTADDLREAQKSNCGSI